MVTPQQIFEFAERLIKPDQPPELWSRQAAARAYYSVLLLVRDAVFRPDQIPSSESHALVKQELDARIAEGGAEAFLREAQSVWKTMKEDRVVADYMISQPFDPKRAQAAVHRARIVFRKLKGG